MPLTAIDANRPSPSKGQNSPGQDVKQTLNQAEKCLPRWMENMGFVARFFMYEIDQRFAKKFVLYFYLEDGSISIGESPDYSRLSSGPPPHEGKNQHCAF